MLRYDLSALSGFDSYIYLIILFFKNRSARELANEGREGDGEDGYLEGGGEQDVGYANPYDEPDSLTDFTENAKNLSGSQTAR